MQNICSEMGMSGYISIYDERQRVYKERTMNNEQKCLRLGVRTLWILNNKLHREDGPAYESPEKGIVRWYLDGKEIEVPNNDNSIFLRMMKMRAFM